MTTEQRKTVRLTIDLKLLTDIWDNRENTNDDIDTAIEKLLIKGFESRKFNPQTQR